MDEAVEEPDQEFAESLSAQVRDLWLLPELERRGDIRLEDVTKALVVMGSPVTVQFNDEFALVARSTTPPGGVEAGDQVELRNPGDIERVKPADVDPNTGWLVYWRLGDSIILAFDFRANRAAAAAMLELAESHLVTAKHACGSGNLGPAIDCALSAAELSVKATMHLIGQSEKVSHSQRLRFWDSWVELGNAPSHVAETFQRLTDECEAARYADRPISITTHQVVGAISDVEDIINAARSHHGSDDDFLNQEFTPPT
jgi:hypothetical protein